MSLDERPKTNSSGSDVNPETALREAFRNSPFAAIKHLDVGHHEGVVTLRGKVPTFYTRQMALTMVRQVMANAVINDHISVDGNE